MKFQEIACAALPDDVFRHVDSAISQRWKGARLYMPSKRRRCAAEAQPRNAAEQFARHVRVAVEEAGGTSGQADEILTALSGGHFWV